MFVIIQWVRSACVWLLQLKKFKIEKTEKNLRAELYHTYEKTQQMTQHTEASNFILKLEIVMQDSLSLEVGQSLGHNIVVHLS